MFFPLFPSTLSGISALRTRGGAAEGKTEKITITSDPKVQASAVSFGSIIVVLCTPTPTSSVIRSTCSTYATTRQEHSLQGTEPSPRPSSPFYYYYYKLSLARRHGQVRVITFKYRENNDNIPFPI